MSAGGAAHFAWQHVWDGLLLWRCTASQRQRYTNQSYRKGNPHGHFGPPLSGPAINWWLGGIPLVGDSARLLLGRIAGTVGD